MNMDEGMSMLESTKAMEDRMLAELVWLAPIGALVLTSIVAVLLSLFVRRDRQGVVAAVGVAGHLLAVALVAVIWLARGPARVMEGTVSMDGLALTVIGLIGTAGAVTVLLSRPTVAGSDREGEFYALLTAANLGAAVLVAAADIALVSIALGMLSLTSFVLTGYARGSAAANEASIKYYIYGTVAGAGMMFGFSWWFGLTGETALAGIGEALPDAPTAAVVASTALVVLGLGYKAALVPFHFWTPDVYAGAPLPVAAYLSVLPKIAGLVALARVLAEALPGDASGWSVVIAVIAAVTMTLGNLAALWQRDVVRLLAYSSIAQSGYLLMGVAALTGSPDGLPSLVFYAIAYAATNLAAFAVVLAVQRERGSADVAAFAGLGRHHPWWTVALGLALLSLLGLPPLSGFVGKLEVFAASIDAGLAWLAVVGVANTVISLFYYLRVLAPTVLEPGTARARGPTAASLSVALAVATVVTVGAGVGAQPLLDLAANANMIVGAVGDDP